jgi:hypothetical protein
MSSILDHSILDSSILDTTNFVAIKAKTFPVMPSKTDVKPIPKLLFDPFGWYEKELKHDDEIFRNVYHDKDEEPLSLLKKLQKILLNKEE